MSAYSGLSDADRWRMNHDPSFDPTKAFKSGAFDRSDKGAFKQSSFLDAIGKNPEAVGTFAQMLSAAGTGRDRGYNQSGGFGGYGGSSRMSGSGQFMQDLGGTPGYSSSSLFMPDGQGGWGGVGGYGGKRSTGDRLRSGAAGAAGGAMMGAQIGAAGGPIGMAAGAGLGFLQGFLA
tara:strand:+ start:745 stop:1272 length:528 start_codon:yes stop_codon:yes gene_type:complete